MQRKRLRLREFDYSEAGYYYITVCVDKKQNVLSKIENGISVLSKYGRIVDHQLNKIPLHYPFLKIDCYIIMPDHIHLILLIKELEIKPFKKNVSAVIGAFKSHATKRIRYNGLKDFTWQRSFFDRIIRSDKQLYFIRKYIVHNPINKEIKELEGNP